MKRTRPSSLIGLGVAGLVVGFLAELAAAGMGQPVFIPPLTLPITLVAVAIIVIAFALPIRRAVRGRSVRRIDPFQATRIVVLAKACGLSGALLTGIGIGIGAYLLSRDVLPGGNAILLTALTTAGAVILLVAGLVAELFCTLPPGDDDDRTETVNARSD
ncbi:Protein of unknown function [Leifsonia sp. 98AMF]|uniref:DUF3180 domain-containing protein n=1 Tax=unclassified Leifsonia TaxID=2663824 RepID=UPI000879BE82|nr:MULTISPECIES: DUF3180 domain-containing protein [unclassified Leifsonia]SDH62587.1 Protein of unknown function [Leifsonia sp. 197AMF]SDI76632.1 Protein of unknown function [Leifsonia sp. 466MF]SDK10517.1 Protein of unknown function [Leifsonia sp. 157MF]SDN79966.1 Protein of unknown function [Leifsonia sp. 509MF]SEN27584.1 Protein of unknown function [Leifsonia sp. 467MF]